MRLTRHVPPCFVAVSLALLVSAAKAERLPMDQSVTMGPVQAVCTGVGSAQDNPAWNAYPIRLVFSNGGAQFVAGVHVALSQGAHALADFECMGPWVLLQTPPGEYKAAVTLIRGTGTGETKNVAFTVAKGGAQKRVEIQFTAVPPNE